MESVFCTNDILAGMKGPLSDKMLQKFGCGLLLILSCHFESMRRTMIEKCGVDIATHVIKGRDGRIEGSGPLVKIVLCALTRLMFLERSDNFSIITNQTKTCVTVATVDIKVVLAVVDALIWYPIKTVQQHGCKIYQLLSQNWDNVHLMRDTMRLFL